MSPPMLALKRRPALPVASSDLEDRAVAAYLGLAIGDALGATVEFLTPNEIRHRYGVHRDIIGGGWLKLQAGQVTDDTTMSLALGQAILAQGGRVEPLAVARALDDWMRKKPVDIGNTVRRNLMAFRRTGIPEAPPSEHDAGNGAAMRVLPVALASFGRTAADVALAAQAQAHVTHNNTLSDAACLTLCRMVHDMLADNGSDQAVASHVAALEGAHPAFDNRGKRRENPSGFIVETLQSVFQALFSTQGFEDCLIDVVNRGGDADTTGAIAGFLAGARYGLAGIPERWIKALNPNIRQACTHQATALVQLALGTPPPAQPEL